MFVSIEINDLKFRWDRRRTATVSLAIWRDHGGCCIGSDSGETITVCELERRDNKVLTDSALRLDEFVPRIAAMYDGDRKSAMALVKERLSLA